jgi:H2-forming N5,N10-methylenetetrahydromethanopterin dehydrogenase-like enzyme
MNKFARFSLPVALSTIGGYAVAAVPADVTTAITDMKADALTVATAVLVAVIAVYAIKFIRKGM